MKLTVGLASILIFLCSCSKQDNPVSDVVVDQELESGCLERTNIVFSQFEYGTELVNKYRLSSDEESQIGIWFVFGSDMQQRENVGPGISISFFPNRVFKTYMANRKTGEIEYTFGKWRVQKRNLYIMPEVVALKSETGIYGYKYYKTPKYYRIMHIPVYDKAYINKAAYSFRFIPSKVRKFFDYEDNDAIRYRMLWDTLGDPPGDLSQNAKNGRVFRVDSIAEKLFEEMICIW